MAYSEQDGTYRHAGKNIGEIAHLYPRSKNSATVLGSWFISFFATIRVVETCRALLGRTADGGCPRVILFSLLQRLLNYLKSPPDLVSQFGKFKFEHGLPGIDYHIHWKPNCRPT